MFDFGKIEKNKEGGSYCKTSNIIKTEKWLFIMFQ